MNKTSRLKKNNNLIKVSRLKRNIFAEWSQINSDDPNLIQYFTDAMTYGYPVQIDYEGSGWRNIQPYGWNTSKDGNVLIMCYKDTGEVRSYRLDKIEDMYIDMTADGTPINDNPGMTNDQSLDNNQSNDDIPIMDTQTVDMPLLPEDNIQEIEPGIYDEELSLFNQDNSTVEQPSINNEQPVIEDEQQPQQELNDEVIEPNEEDENNINKSEEKDNE